MRQLEKLWWQLLCLMFLLPIGFALALQVMGMLVAILAPIIVIALALATAIVIIAGCIALGAHLLRRGSTLHVNQPARPHHKRRVPLTVQPMRRPRRIKQ